MHETSNGWQAVGRTRLLLWMSALAVLLAGCSRSPEIMTAYLSADGMTIELEVDTCNADLAFQVEESDTAVAITVEAENDTNDDCLDNLVISIDEPLGDRDLIDRSTGEVVRVVPGER